MQIVVRPYNADTDKGFLYSTWLKGLFYGSAYFSSIDKPTYFEKYEKVLDHILSKPGVEIRIAGFDDEQDTILGYAVVEGDVVHWVHVKTGWRKQGLAKKLIGSNPVTTVSHITPAGDAIRKKLNLRHDPWRI